MAANNSNEFESVAGPLREDGTIECLECNDMHPQKAPHYIKLDICRRSPRNMTLLDTQTLSQASQFFNQGVIGGGLSYQFETGVLAWVSGTL